MFEFFRISSLNRAAIALYVAVIVCVCAHSQEDGPESEVVAESDVLEYQVAFEGIDDAAFVERLERLSECVSQQGEGANSALHLRRRMTRDVEAFESLLRSEGYFWGRTSGEVVEDESGLSVVFTVKRKQRCTFGTISISAVDTTQGKRLVEMGAGGLVTGEPARADVVRGAEAAILSKLRESGYPFPVIADRKTVVDSNTKTMDVSLVVDTGAHVVFGEVTITGLKHVRESVVTIEQPWLHGDVYDVRKMELYRKRLYDTGLFTVVQVLATREIADGAVPVLVDVVERAQRTLGFGASYYSDEGVGVTAQWQHRNLWGEGRVLDLESQFSQQVQSLGARLTLKHFLIRQQELQFSVLAANEDLEAYDSEHVGGRVWLTRRLANPHMAAGVGVAVRFTEIEQFGERNSYQLFSVPTEVSWDNSDDLLDPTRGFRWRGQLEPFVNLGGESTEFLKSQFAASYYLSLDEVSTFILASRFKIGMLGGATTKNLPPDERFYAGGGGSVRGYPYQSLGPQFKDDPLGGSSLLETSVEMRYRISETIGAVAFLDGGSAFDSEYPDFGETVRWGAGVGLRYFSPIGPFRFDVAVPINKPDYVDESFQVYLSIGQAF